MITIPRYMYIIHLNCILCSMNSHQHRGSQLHFKIKKRGRYYSGLNKSLNNQLRSFIPLSNLDQATSFQLLLPFSGFVPGQNECDAGSHTWISRLCNNFGGREGPATKGPVEDIMPGRSVLGCSRSGFGQGIRRFSRGRLCGATHDTFDPVDFILGCREQQLL